MFEETIRALKNLEGKSKISVPIGNDEEGYYDRECPSEECLFQFKVLHEDWRDKVRDEEVFCPNCGHSADSSKWWTQEQLAHAREAALARIKASISGALNLDASQWNSRQPRGGFVSITMRVNNVPQQVPLPSATAEPMKLKIVCPACQCRYAGIGAAYFCPACSHNAAGQVFVQTISGIRRCLDALGTIRDAIGDPDTAENTIRLLVENSLQNVVTAFQRCAEALFLELPNKPKARRNAFQNLGEGDQLWSLATGRTYGAHLSAQEIELLTRGFQQRHLLAHTQGIIDQDYVTKSSDARYQPGQRLVIRVESVLETVDLIEKLVNGMSSDAAAAKAT